MSQLAEHQKGCLTCRHPRIYHKRRAGEAMGSATGPCQKLQGNGVCSCKRFVPMEGRPNMRKKHPIYAGSDARPLGRRSAAFLSKRAKPVKVLSTLGRAWAYGRPIVYRGGTVLIQEFSRGKHRRYIVWVAKERLRPNPPSHRQWMRLAAAYSRLKTIPMKYVPRLQALMSQADNNAILELARRDVKFISALARNEAIRRGLISSYAELRKNPRGRPIARVKDYQLIARNGRPIRKATMVIFQDGRTVRFVERLGKKEAIRQATRLRGNPYRVAKHWRNAAKLAWFAMPGPSLFVNPRRRRRR